MEAYEEPQVEAEEEEPPCFATPIEKLQVQHQPLDHKLLRATV